MHDIESKLAAWTEKELLRNINNLIINDVENNEVIAFGRYRLVPVSNAVQVWTESDCVGTFSGTRSAISYCIASKFQDFNLSRMIKDLDHRKRLSATDIDTRKKAAEKSKDPGFRQTVLCKLDHKIASHKSLKTQLEKCIDRAKYLQIRGFTHEIARTRNT